MSYQDSNQPYGTPQQPQGQQIPGQGQGQPQGQGQGQSGGWGQQQGSWGQPGGVSQPQSSGPQQNSGQGSWGAHPGQFPMPPQQPGYEQPNYGAAPGYGQPGQSGPQDYQAQQFNQQQPGYGQGYPGGPQGYLPQTDFGSGAGYYGPGYPMPSQGSSGLATTALWLGILGGWGVINLVISILAIRETGPGKKLGRNKAITGLVLTIAWAAVWTGVFVAVSGHADNQLQPVSAPTAPVVATTSATGSAVGQATGATSDPGCQAAQSAFNTYDANSESGGLGAIQTLGNSLIAASDKSQTAGSQLQNLGNDFLQLANASTPANMVNDLVALNAACGISFNFTG